MSQEGDGDDAEVRAMTHEMAKGNEIAWQTFHANFGPKIFRWLLGRTRGDAALADEALQRVYLRVARHVRRCDTAAEFHAWLWKVARSSAFDTQRAQFRFWRRHAAATAEANVIDETPLFGGDANPADAKLEAALAALPTDSAELLRQKYLLGKSVREMATAAHVSEKTIESRLTRARAHLRELYLRNIQTGDL